MSFAASVSHLQTLVLSFHPVIVMETVEEERVEALIHGACKDLQMAVFEWSVAQGLVRSPSSPSNRWQNEYAPPGGQRNQAIGKTTEPLDMLRHIQDMSFKAIYWLKDFAHHLKDPVVARQFREVAEQFSHNQSTLIVSGEGISLPASISHDAFYFDIKLPEPEELYGAVSDVVRALRGRVKVELTPEDIHALVK
ncbi:AAA family ATPase, partial [filamentous cyanobacterium CCP5]